MAEGGDEMDLVADLLSKPFSRRSFQEKLDIVKKSRATPKLASLSQSGKGFVRHFQSTNYERYPWLTGSEEHCRLYCWECLLFATDRHGVWSHTGFAKLTLPNHSSNETPKHCHTLTSNGAFQNF